MAKGQKRSNKETKKPKQTKAAPAPVTSSFTPSRAKPGASGPAKSK